MVPKVVGPSRWIQRPILMCPSLGLQQGAAISSSLSLGLTYCFCNAAGSICNSCFGSTAEGTTGRKRSVLLLTLSIAIALWFQYSIGPSIIEKKHWVPYLGSWVYNSWYDACEMYSDDEHLLRQCAGNAGVYRAMSISTLFFAVAAIATKVQPNLNREAWPAKYALFAFAVALTMVLNSAPMFSGVYLWLARIGAAIFVLLQQVILIDVAYNWNEDWVDKADQADRLSYGSGSSWLHAVVATCAGFYIASIVGISLLYKFFDGCSENIWIITLTLLGIVALTGIQLSGSEGSLLTSSMISLYATYLAYSMVSKNPDGECNPQLGGNDFWGITIGLTLTAVSLAWTGWSWTAEERLNVDSVQSARSVNVSNPGASDNVNLDVPFLDPNDQPTSGLVLDSGVGSSSNTNNLGSGIWKLNVVMVLISCFVAMTLTGWGTILRLDENENAANPTVGRVNMAMIGISQWCVILLYVWTLVASRVFPDREFS